MRTLIIRYRQNIERLIDVKDFNTHEGHGVVLILVIRWSDAVVFLQGISTAIHIVPADTIVNVTGPPQMTQYERYGRTLVSILVPTQFNQVPHFIR